MRLPHGVRRTFRLLVPGAYRDEVDEELEFHLECTVDDLVAAGMEPAAARREAQRRFGDARRVGRECRAISRSRETAERRAGLRHDLRQDLRWALRRLSRAPGFALATVAILAVGIGASTALFSIADAVLFRPLPFPEPDRLIWLDETTPQGDRFSVSLPNLLDWRRESDAFSGIAAFQLRNAALDASAEGSADGEPRRVLAAPVTMDFFTLLGLRPAVGRLLPPEAFLPGGDADRAVLSHELWSRDFGGDAAVVGSTVVLDGQPTVIAGVLPPGATFPEGAEIWVPLPEDRFERGDKEVAGIGRLAPGVSADVAAADLGAVAERLGERHPEANQGWGVEVRPLRAALLGSRVQTTLLVLLGAVGVLLLIACVNVSSLLVARGAARAREMAVRTSLGAPRSRLVRQLLVEAGAIGLLGGMGGVVIALGTVEAVRLWGPTEVPRLTEASVDGRVLAFSAAAALLASLLAGLLPALQTSRTRPGEDLRSGGRTTSAATARLRGALVVTQLALAVTLLVGASLTARSYLRLLGVDLGFDPTDVLAVRVDLPQGDYPPERRQALAEEARRRLAALPGVASVAASVGAPYAGFFTANQVAVPGFEADAAGGYPVAQWRSVTPGYFETLDVPLLRGRAITDEDRAGGGAVVVSRSFAEQFFPGEEALDLALGREFLFGGAEGSPRVIVGVVGDVRDAALEEAPRPTIFLPYQQIPWVHQTWLVETVAERAAVAAAVREELRRLVPGVPIPEVEPLAANLGVARANPRFQALLLAAFAVAAVVLAASGVYGLMAFAVARRRREIGVRMALGARPGAVVAMVARQGAALVAAGAALGVVGAFALARTLGSLLYETAPSEATTYVAAIAVLAAVGLLAAYLPARRAAEVDPTVALTAE